MSRAHHCEDIVNRGAAGAVRADQALMVATADLPTEWIVIETRNASPPASASAAEEPPKTKKPAVTPGVTAGSIDLWDAFSGVTPSRTLGSPQRKKAMDGFFRVKNGRYRTRTYDP